MMPKRRFVPLDRDGTIIVERNYLSDPNEVELLPGSAKGLRRMRELGLGLVVITNQSAIGRGFTDEKGLSRVHQRMFDLLEMEGVFVDGIYACPHLPEDNCDCRKPGIALPDLASKELAFDPPESFVIGDKDCDIAMGRRIGATTFLVLTGYGALTNSEGMTRPDFLVEDLRQAATTIEHLLEEEAEE
jgi:D-glycero-D-manno-heptose 1,7-bisphosphate phosphatase